MKNNTLKMIILAVAVTGIALTAGVAVNSRRSNQHTADQPAMQNTSAPHSQVDLKSQTGDAYDSAFITQMSEHHAGAVAMANLLLTAPHAEVQTLARQIIAAQTQELSDMQAWATAWGYTYIQPSQSAINAMTANLAGKTGEELEKQFFIDMTSHHQGALDVAALSAQNAKHAEIKTLSENILASQTAEITLMQNLAAQYGYTLTTTDPTHNTHGM